MCKILNIPADHLQVINAYTMLIANTMKERMVQCVMYRNDNLLS